MGNLFKDMLKSGESLFRDTVALDYDYLPKIIPYREQEQRQFAFAIKPLLQERSGRNLFVYGVPGIGKTAACKHVLRELEEETDNVIPVYINCWKHNTVYKMLLEMCNQLHLRFITSQKTSELFEKIKNCVNKKSVVFVFDEVDKIEDFDVLYMVLEEVYRKSVFLITNYKDKVEQLDERIMSRLNPELIEFKPYNKKETSGILMQRLKYAFVPHVWDNDALNHIVEKTAQVGDIRKGLFLMREAGTIAEDHASKKITLTHVEQALNKVERFHVHEKEELDQTLQNIFELVKKHPGNKSGDLFQLFLKSGGEMSYRTFTRKIEILQKGKYISCQKVVGKDGNTTIINLYGEKKLTDY